MMREIKWQIAAPFAKKIFRFLRAPSCTSWIALLCVAAGWCTQAAGDDSERRLLDGLRQRRLFLLAEHYCEDRLRESQLPAGEVGDLTVELVRLYAEHAVQSPPDARIALARKARDTAAEFVRQHKDNPRLLLVRMQDALTVLALAELARQEGEIAIEPEPVFETARQFTREATRLLEQFDKELVQRISQSGRKPAVGELSADEMTALLNNVRYQLARAHRNQALCYAPASDDRIAALSQSLEQLERTLKQVAPDDPLAWRIRVDQIVVLRLAEKLAEAQTALDALEPKDIPTTAPPAIQLAARAEAVRLQLAAGKLDVALRLLAEGREITGQVSPELDLAILETYVALWQAAEQAKNPARAAESQQKAVAMLQMIDQTHGPYWRHRGDRLLVRSAAGGRGDANLEILARTADNFYLKGQFDEAVAAYDKAASLAEGDNPGLRFELAYKAALVLQQRRQFADAGRRLRVLSLAAKSHAKASDAHLLAAWNLAQAARDELQLLSQYGELLVEHVTTWPRAATANQARVWLGAFQESQQAWRRAIDAYQGTEFSSPHFDAAVKSLGPCWLRHLAEIKSSGQPHERDAELAARWFEKVCPAPDASPRPTWTATQQAAALSAARIRLQFTSDGGVAAERILRAALAGSADAAEAWIAAAQSLLVVALAGQANRLDDAQQVLREIAGGSHERLLETLEGLTGLADAATPDVRGSLAKLQLATADMLGPQRDRLSPPERLRLEIIRAAALAAAGRCSEALSAYQKLAQANPNDARAQEAYAELLLTGDDNASWRQALDQWRKIASRSPPRSPRWWRAKYSVALAQFKLGEKQPAAQLIRYLQETPPGLDETELRPKFLELLKRCEP